MPGDLDLALRIRTDLDGALRELRGLRGEVTKLGTSSTAGGRQARELGRGLDRARGAARNMVTQLGLMAAAYVSVAQAGRLVGKAQDFDTSLSRITGLVGTAKEEVEKYRAEILKLPKETGRGVNELGDALFFIASAGAEGAEALDILRQSAKAAASGLGDTTAIADAATSAMNTYGAETLAAGDAIGTLIATVREGKLDAASLAPQIGPLLPLAKQLGVEFHEVGAGLAVLSRSGFNAANASTALRGIFTQLIRPSEQARKAMKDHQLSVEDLRRSLSEEGLLSTLLKIRDALGENQDAISKIFPDTEGLVGVLTLLSDQGETVAEIFQSLAMSGVADLDTAFKVAADSIEFRFNAALRDMEAQGIQIGSELLPSMAAAVELLAENLRLVVAAVGILVGYKLGLVLAGAGAGAIVAVRGVGTLSGAMLALNAAMRANPAFLVASGVAAVGGALAAMIISTEDAADATDELAGKSRLAIDALLRQAEAELAVAEAQAARRDALGEFSAIGGDPRIAELRAEIERLRAALTDLGKAAGIAMADVEYGLGKAAEQASAAATKVGDGPAESVSAAATEIERIIAASQDTIARLTLSRIALIDRKEAKALRGLEDLRGAEGVAEERLQAAIAAVRERAFQEREIALQEQLDREHEIRQDRAARLLEAERSALKGLAVAVRGQLSPYEQARAAAETWKTETLLALDDVSDGYDALAAQVEDVYVTRIRAIEEEEQERRLRESTEFRDGAVRAFRDIQAEADGSASAAKEAIANAFQGAEEALVRFASTGKLRFRDLANSIIADLVRISIRRSITAPLAGALGDIFGETDDGGTDGGGSAASGFPYNVGHAGLIAGVASGTRRTGVSPATFAGAGRYHGGGLVGGFGSGLGPGEIPIIARRGEGVFTPEQMSALGAPPQITVNFENRGTPQRLAEPTRQAFDGRSVVVTAIVEDIASNGASARAIEGAFDVRRRSS